MLPELPVEIHRKIYAMACMDDGSAGCALSLVSRAVRDVSADYRWFSIAVSGGRQAHSLLKTLSALPAGERKVIHLYISDGDRPVRGPRSPRLVTMQAAEQALFGDDDDDDELDIRAITALFRVFGQDSTPPIGRSIMELLQLLSSTLETLFLLLLSLPPGLDPRLGSLLSDSPPQLRGLDLSRLSLPALTELTLRGVYGLPSSLTFAPALKLLHIADEALRPGMEKYLALNHPELTHLRISRILKIQEHRETITRLAVVMGIRAPSEDEELAMLDNRLVRFPDASSRFYLVEPGPTRMWGRWTSQGYGRRLHHHQGWKTVTPPGYESMFRDFAALSLAYPNFVVLPPHPGGNKGKEAGRARKQWLGRVEGGPGCWAAPGKEISGI
ncbi:hypothetical protein CALCODRAFT_491599 [Calocera cornea HHB12733]|uniref:Uncharacterized protein n=1 Tax=Calocera cornea HHB12733 TaxID=1353952 RepID=A0A165IZW4_9BASI|nr:hypothetical protein CALCODRAFT_491599 [Calocera cornea HHB12733]